MLLAAQSPVPYDQPTLATYDRLATYHQDYSPLGDSLGLSSIVAILPLLVLFVLLGAIRMTAWRAALISLAVAVATAVGVYSMPLGDTLNSGLMGAAFGFFPIMWIVINAIWVYNLTVETGHFDVLRRSFASISDDQRVQAILIAFCFGALMEALAGFGTPVAISAVMLIALGFAPLKAATVALVANTAPVAFGALAVPITTLSGVTGLSVDDLGAMVGRQTPVLSVFVPLALVFIVDGRRGLRQTWPPALLAGVVFGLFQYLSANFWSVPLADIIGALAAAFAILAFTRVWHAAEGYVERDAGEEGLGGASGGRGSGDNGSGGNGSGRGGSDRSDARVATRVTTDTERTAPDSRREVFRAYAPYLAIITVFVLATRIPAITGTAPKAPGESGTGLEAATRIVDWPGLHIINQAGDPVATTFKLNYLSAAGTLLLLSGLITMALLRIAPARGVRAYGRTLEQLKTAILTVMLVLALGFIMNQSGQTTTLGLWMAGAGAAFAFFSPILGWLGVAVTGSDTSSNSLFGLLQVTAANQADLSPVLMAAGNSSGGVLGKMISPQNLAIAASAVGFQGREGVLFRRVVGWSLVFVLFMCVLVYLQSTPVLEWMVVGPH